VRRRGLGTVLVGFGTTLAVILFNATMLGDRVWRWIFTPLARQLWWDHKHTWLGELGWRIVYEVTSGLVECLGAGLAATSLAGLAIIIARVVATARARAGRADPLDRLRQRPRRVRVLASLPAALFAFPWVVESIWDLSRIPQDSGPYALNQAIASLVTAGVIGTLAYTAGRAGMRGLLAPVGTDEAAAPKDPGEIVFSAVAVTTRTRAAVAALGAATVAMVAWTLVNPNDAAFPWALAAYITAAMSAPFALRRVSRIAVGLDGVWVRDASRALFFAYRDLDGARARGADLELVAKDGRTVLRLQMHGDDAGRRDEVLARVQDAIVRSRAGDTRGAEMLVRAMPTGHVVASAAGDARYRLPSISRQQLWDLVESPATDGTMRTAAAEALAIHIDEADRARLRVAAEQCAEPRVRVALAALADEEAARDAAAEEEGAAAAQR
jgi:hypothetical protein